MHRIQKYNVGGGINVDWAKMLNLPSISPTSPSDTIQKAGNFLASTLANSGSKIVPDISKMRGLLKPGGLKDLGTVIGGGFNNLLGQGVSGTNILGGLKEFTGLNPSGITGIAGDLAGMGLDALGVRKADSNNLSTFDKGLGVAKQVTRFIPGAGWVASAALEGLDLINKYAGKTSKKQGTADMGNIYGYGMADVNESANTKYTFSDTIRGWFGKSKREKANEKTKAYDRMNLLKSVPGYDHQINLLAANNTSPLIQQKNQQQLLGGINTGMLAAKKGTKIKKFQDGGDLNGLITLIKSTRGSGRRLFKPKPQVNTFEGGKGGRFGGGGAGSSYLTPNYIVKDSTYVQPFILHQNDFRNAFEDARKKGLSEFVFNNKRYNTNVDTTNTINHDAIARQRIENVALPLDTVYLHNVKTRTSDDFIESKSDTINLPLHLATEYENSINKKKAVKPHNFKNIILKAEKSAREFKKGGKLENTTSSESTAVNVIPEGAFHSRKNNLPDEIAEHVTHKGIPVVTEEEGGRLQQHAEIEKNEIIFHKEATEKIESWLEDYNNAETQEEKDLIAIECGKYIANEILVNTQDNTGLIDTVQ